jgi:hypothetical protein
MTWPGRDAARARNVRTTTFRACHQQDFAVIIDRATKADQGLCPISKAVRALPQTHVNGTALHQASQIPGSGGFLPIFLPKEATHRSRGALSPGHSSKME